MYFAAKKLGRYQLADSPTTAIVLHSLRIRRSVLISVVSLIRTSGNVALGKAGVYTGATVVSFPSISRAAVLPGFCPAPSLTHKNACSRRHCWPEGDGSRAPIP